MAQQYNPTQNIKIRQAILVFIKGSTAPLVLYVKEPQAFYNELLELMKSAKPVLIEKETEGPIKKVCFAANQIVAVAIQEEQIL